ncbi:MAG: zf-HC2 domain-containing protein [Acidobacteriota bacterium]
MDARSPSEHACESVAQLIDDLIGGTLGKAEKADLDAHLTECTACRMLARDLDDIHRVARELPVRSPRANAWERIAERLDAEGRTPGDVARRRWASARIVLPLAAALVLVAGASLTYLVWPGGSVPAVHGTREDLVRSIDQELRLAESHYENAIAGLEQIAADGEKTLTPEVAATLQKNIGIIDQAINESRQALTDQPESTLARESLFEALRRKVSLLEDTITLINVMRKGDQTGTAKVIEGLSKS